MTKIDIILSNDYPLFESVADPFIIIISVQISKVSIGLNCDSVFDSIKYHD